MTTMDDTELTADDALLLDAVHERRDDWPAEERDAARARLESAGWSRGSDGVWRKPQRPDQAPATGESVASKGPT